MLDIQLIRREPDRVRAALARRGPAAAAAIDRVLELDASWRAVRTELEELQAEQNRASKGRKGPPTDAERAQLAQLAARGRELSDRETAIRAQRDRELAALPSLPADDAPDEDTVIREVGQAGKTGRDHLELAGPLIDMEHAAVVAGSRFAYLRGALVMLELALVRFALETLSAQGFEPVIPPVLVREKALYGTGFLPDTEQQIYRLADDDLYLVGTSEVPLASLHQDEILPADALPRRYAGYSPCFRREAGAAGKDTRGIFRVHQFDKVEMFSYVAPEDSQAEHQRLLEWEKQWLTSLELPFRVIDVASGDLGASAARKFDCEAWIPTQGKYRELTSTSDCTEFQSRRLSIRVRDGKQVKPLATLNGTLCAVPRTIVAILENHQQADGSVRVPEVLRPYLGGREVLEPVAK
jgi:seryl-tRNA synthetase